MTQPESFPISLTRRADAVDDAGESTVVWVRGDHDESTSVALAAVIARASDLDDADVLVDLSGVTFMDASIVGTLIRARNQLRARGLSLYVRAPSFTARRLLDMCGLTDLLLATETPDPKGYTPAPASESLAVMVQGASG